MPDKALDTPNTTTAQYVAYATAALTAIVVLFKLDVSDVQQGAAITLLGAVLAAFHLYSDAKIRNGRATMAAAITTANFAAELRHADLEMPHFGTVIPPAAVAEARDGQTVPLEIGPDDGAPKPKPKRASQA